MIPRPRTVRRSDQPSGSQLGRGLAYALGTFLLLSLLLLVNLGPRVYEFREGDVSGVNVKSPRKLTFVSQVATRQERERAAASVPEQLEIDVGILTRQRQGQNALHQSINATRANATIEQRREALRHIANPPFSEGELNLLAILDDRRVNLVFQDAQRMLSETLRERVSEQRAQELVRQLPSMVTEQLSEAERGLAVELTRRFVRANLIVNRERTAQLREDARQAVAPVQTTVESGEIVLREGQVVSATDIEKLELLGLRHPTADWRASAGTILLAFVITGALAAYVVVCQPALLQRDRRLQLMVLVIIVVALAAKLVVPGRPLWVYVFPLPAVAMVLSTLLDARLGIFMSVLLSILVAQIAGGGLEVAVMFIGACTVAAAVVWRRERAQFFFLAGALSALIQFLTVLGFMLLDRAEDMTLLVTIGFECLVNGMGSAVLAAGSGILVGRLFGITTTWQLLELANPTHPLLRRLMSEAPGTYHHSLIVGNLAERSAEAIGADPLLARVASYYHDVGKLRRPYFFVENQMDGVNPHDSLEPRESARIVAAHVSDGVEIAERYGLPTRIREMIPQHHGTRLVSFFYQKAQEQNAIAPGPQEFTYPGPRPQSKEAAIVMMADSVEASTRAQKDHSPDAIERLVERIITERFAEGQFDECDLTLRDLQRIKESFTTLLIGMYHPRIEYPEKVRPREEANGASGAPPHAAQDRPEIGAAR